MKQQWTAPLLDPRSVLALESELGLNTLLATTLVARGYTNVAQAEHFMNISMENSWGDAAEITGMLAVVDSLESAVRSRQRILIFGDYDVDGLTSTALLCRALKELGSDVATMIPNRLNEGYGLSPRSVARIIEANPQVLITVDCGISALEEVEELLRHNIQVIVTDHHEPSSLVPQGIPITDPKLDAGSPDAILAGVGVVLKLVELLFARFEKNEHWQNFIELATLGTLSDLMPLVEKNRALVREGLRRMNTSLLPCLAALNVNRSSSDTEISSTSLSFSVIPRLNATGRMGDAQISLDLLLADDIETSFDLAVQIEKLNTERRETESLLFRQVDEQAASYPSHAHVLVLGGEGWHEGVKGIVASRLTNTYGVPTIIFSIEGDIARGSGRSVGSINLFEAVEKCADILIRFGGHEAAVGVTLQTKDLPLFRNRLESIIACEPKEHFHPPLQVDAVVDFSHIQKDALEELKRLEPYGQDNPTPLYILKNVFITKARAVGSEKNHFSFTVTDGINMLPAIWFNCPALDHWLSTKSAVAIAFTPKMEIWNGRKTIKLHVKDIFEKPIIKKQEPTSNKNTIAPKLPAEENPIDAAIDWHTLAQNDPIAFADAFTSRFIHERASLHDAQRKSLDSLLQKKNTLTIMATGRGKSHVFHIYAAIQALSRHQASIFVFPLRALINDQAYHLASRYEELGLKALVLTGEVKNTERHKAFKAFETGAADIILTTPEFLELHAEHLARAREVSFLVIDEAHHLATSSENYRSAYTRFSDIASIFPNATVFAITATADAQAIETIRSLLSIESLIIDPTERSNLSVIDQRNIEERERYTASIIAAGEKTLVYVNTRDETMLLARTLRKLLPSIGHRIAFYHAGLTKEDRCALEDALRKGTASCICCTSAFGEGINIPDIRNVILYHTPFSVLDFNQVAGRGGRDGSQSHIYLVFNSDDQQKGRQLIAKHAPSRNELAIVWRALKKLGVDSFKVPEEVNSPLDISESDYKYFLQTCISVEKSFTLDTQGVKNALAVFADVGLISIIKRKGVKQLIVNESREKVDLEKSIRYREGLVEHQAFKSFCEWVMNADVDEICTRVSRPLTPATG